jgi:adenylate cyclase
MSTPGVVAQERELEQIEAARWSGLSPSEWLYWAGGAEYQRVARRAKRQRCVPRALSSWARIGGMHDASSPGSAGRQTFIFVDLAGYTALTEAHGDEHAADAVAAFCAAVRARLDDYDAEEIKAIGDALLIRVPDAAKAVRLAARVVRDFGRHQALGVRVGMHTGTAVQRDGDWFGAAVNLAARVADAARSGEVLMTAATREAAGDALLAGQIRSRGPVVFRNISEPVEIAALVLDDPGTQRLPVDPVCRMAVDPTRSHERTVYRGIAYHFCSTTCHEAFTRDPRRYT